MSLDKIGMDGLGLETALPYPSEVLDSLFSRRLFNSTMNYIVPMVEVALPLRTEDGNTLQLAMQAFLGLFSVIAWVSTVAIPLFLTHFVPFTALKKRSEQRSMPSEGFQINLPNANLKSFLNEKVAKDVGLTWDGCYRKTICQAHHNHRKYGLLSIPFRIMFPPQNSESSPERKAAYIGYTSSPESECDTLYPCFFDILDLIPYLYHAFMHRNQS